MKISRGLIGTATDDFEVIVEPSAIKRFCAAVGHPLIYRTDPETSTSKLLAPPTYPITFHSPTLPRWRIGLEQGTLLAGTQNFEYDRPLLGGDVLRCRLVLADIQEKVMQIGKAQLIIQDLLAFDPNGLRVFVNRRTFIYIEENSTI